MMKNIIFKQVKETKGKLFKEYYDLHDKYSKIYGEKVAILMQVGKFFELYAPPDFSRSANIRDITDIINCNLVWKESERMSGFPLVSLEKNVKRLTDNDYTVVVVEQVGGQDKTDEKGKGKKVGKNGKIGNNARGEKREITQIVSKGTVLENTRLRNNIMSIFYHKYGKGLFSFGVSVVDMNISTEIVVHDIHSLSDDKGFALDGAIRVVAQYDPVECIIVTKNGESTDDIQRHLGINCPVFVRDVQMIEKMYMSDNQGLSPPVAYSLGALKMFLAEHRLRPSCEYTIVPFNSGRYLDLCSTAIKQLDLPMFLSRSGKINMTITQMGNRLLCQRLYMPIKDAAELTRRYDSIEKLTDTQCVALKNVLREIPDIEKYHQKMALGRLSWSQFTTLHGVYTKVQGILDEELSSQMNDFIGYYTSIVKVSALDYEGLHGGPKQPSENGDEEQDNEDEDTSEDDEEQRSRKHENIFINGMHTELDEMFAKMAKSSDYVQDFVEQAMSFIPRCKPFKIKEKMGLITTPTRVEILKNKMDIKVLKIQKTHIVYTDELRDHLCLLKTLEDEVDKFMDSLFKEFQIDLYEKYETLLESLCKSIAEIDFQQCGYMMAKQLRLVRPVIAPDNNGKRTLHVEQVRHLLIEHINQDVKYVPNDCSLGDDQDQYGMVLYGVNSCGKTSFLKSVGLAVVMAQAGLFVPAEKMIFSPFSRIMTRIAGSDNMERSQSSYIVELEELLSMIRRSDKETLILGDEMCRGTEIESANAMVFSTLKWLLEKHVMFITATHLHSIAENINKDLPSCKIYHMKVSFDDDGEVIYDRKLAPGPGPIKYGLEIARAMGFPSDFMERAVTYRETQTSIHTSAIRNTVNGTDGIDINVKNETVPLKRSRYNAKKILVKCEHCGYKPNGDMCLPLDTHHIQFQCNADSSGFHGSQHKNALHNLVSVCKECHTKIHRGELEVKSVQGLRETKFIFQSTQDATKDLNV